uniref:Mitochondrial fission regulator n=1 Tax=Petromyzon marinus TaxID=7757 RepID=S4RIN6_PETMA
PELEGKACGPARSLVRLIGTHLPLKPCTRAFIQVPPLLLEVDPEEDQEVPSLADIMWIMDDEGETFSRLRSELRPGKQNRRTNSLASLRKVFSSPCMRGRPAGARPPLAEEDAPSRPRLEEELSHLRAQIALLLA